MRHFEGQIGRVGRRATDREAPPTLVAVVDMGASAIRLVVAEQRPGAPPRVLEEASRGILLGRDTFSLGVIGPETIESALRALDGFRAIMNGYGVRACRAVATSAVREARNADTFLDRVRIHTGFDFEVISESEETRLTWLAVQHELAGHAALRAGSALIAEVGGGGAGITLLARGEPRQSGVYALGAVRMRQGLGLWRHGPEQQMALLNRHIAHVVEEIRGEMPLHRARHFIAVGGDVRLAAGRILDADAQGVREIPRDAFVAFCAEVERVGEDQLLERERLPAADVETLVPAMLVYRALLLETRAPRVIVPDASLRMGLLLDLSGETNRPDAGTVARQVIASAEALGRRYRYDAAHGRAVMTLAARLFDELQEEHGLGPRERLLLEVAALLHDIGIYVSLRAHHKHAQYLLAASQIFGLSNDEMAVVSNVARYHRRALPQRSHLPYIALDRQDRMVVNKLAAILRVANALDAEHLQKVRDVRLERTAEAWVLEIEGTGDLTMERLAAEARADMFREVFGRPLLVRGAGVQA